MGPYDLYWCSLVWIVLNPRTVLCTVAAFWTVSQPSVLCWPYFILTLLPLSCHFVCGWHEAWLNDCLVRCYDEDAPSAFCWLCLFLCERSSLYSVLFVGGRHPSTVLPLWTTSENCLHLRVFCSHWFRSAFCVSLRNHWQYPLYICVSLYLVILCKDFAYAFPCIVCAPTLSTFAYCFCYRVLLLLFIYFNFWSRYHTVLVYPLVSVPLCAYFYVTFQWSHIKMTCSVFELHSHTRNKHWMVAEQKIHLLNDPTLENIKSSRKLRNVFRGRDGRHAGRGIFQAGG